MSHGRTASAHEHDTVDRNGYRTATGVVVVVLQSQSARELKAGIVRSAFVPQLLRGVGDAVRIPAAIVTGVGFLGAGAILRSGERVSGLTTAAGIWVTAAVGVLIGAGFWVIGIASTVILLAIVNVTGWASSRVGIGGDPQAPDADS